MKYRDAIDPCIKLFRKFWPQQRKPEIITDIGFISEDGMTRSWKPDGPLLTWCDTIVKYLEISGSDEPVCFLLEDFFLNALARQDLIEHALEQMKQRNAGMVRLYPCPGSDEDYGDPYVGIVRKGSEYRVSTQVGIWRPDFLHKIASQFNTPWEFEIEGTKYAETLPDEILSWKRTALPFPCSYVNTGILRGKWTKSALEHFEREGISVDLSMREIAS